MVRAGSLWATPSWPKATESSAAATTEPWACATARATILDVDERASAITIQTDRDDTITLPRRYLDDGHVQLGYAMTGHSSQSLTVERAFVLAPDHGEQREWGYVAL